ncbi:glycosyl transferase [Candidatus Marinamargulisbacteria bacterium SCGC AG-343-D04]|nr:glycosyl transferase [Candidatus Marinamargulisbacteria bacterium SCGC AG-343-D04]
MTQKKILYAINGTGQGHISRAKSLIPYLQKYVNVDILISGKLQNLNFDFPIKYEYKGFTFHYEDGAVNWFKTLLKADIFQFITDIRSLDLSEYDLIVTDFEPVSAWCSFINKYRCINVSHQASFYSYKSPRPWFWPFFILAELFFRFYSVSNDYLGVHFKAYSEKIFPPVLKDEIIQATPKTKPHITVYLSAFSLEQQIQFFNLFPEFNFHIFHSHCTQKQQKEHLSLSPLSEDFKFSLISCSGYISNGGFESNAEALYLKKPLLSIPIRNQYEQYCNGAALKKLGVTVIKRLHYKKVFHWLQTRKTLSQLQVCNTDDLAKAISHAIDT